MTTTSQTTRAEHFGRWLGRCARGYVRREGKVLGWLVARGLPPPAATALLWGGKLIVLGVLLYLALWLALLLIFALVAAWVVCHPEDEEPAEWRHGDEGFGLYRNGSRMDHGRLFEEDD